MQLKRLSLFFIIFTLLSCSQLEKAEKLISGLSEREQYKRNNNLTDELFDIWTQRHEIALSDSLQIELPYSESGVLKPRDFAIYSYEAYLIPGEILKAEITTDRSNTLVFTDIYKKEEDANSKFKKITSGNASSRSLIFEIAQKGLYKIVIQPEIEADTPFQINITKNPAYLFPVKNGQNSDIGSYWGDMRDGGKRNHEGIDIFANRGTPVVAATGGRVRFTGEKGLGGKQVWLRDTDRNQSLYYAHLDSIKPGIRKVKAGDTLGFVGNTGNARTTPPHLHFGIYKSSMGAIDPIGFVYSSEDKSGPTEIENDLAKRIMVKSRSANFRNKPAANNSKVVKKGKLGEILYVQGKTTDWYHVRDSLDRPFFIHESVVAPAN